MTTDAWLVDLDGTLYRPLPMKLAMGLRLALAPPRIRKSILTFRQEHDILRKAQNEPAQSPYALQLERAADKLDVDRFELERIVDEWMIRRPCRWIATFKRKRLLAELADFRSSGGRAALVSDYPAREKLDSLEASELFDAVVANGEAGGAEWLKPHPDGYLRAATRLGVPPERCLVIGDRADLDGESARRAGMRFRLVG